MNRAVQRPKIVPYIAAWSREASDPRRVVEDHRTGRIRYLQEWPGDRDEHGVLWERTESRPRLGRPEFVRVHSHRQRHVMTDLLCQVCACPADCTADGVLWLLADHRGDWPGWPERMTVTHPPVCLPCAQESTQWCPHLVKGSVAVRVHSAEIHGVYGELYPRRFGTQRPTATQEAIVAYSNPLIRRVRAAQLVRVLRGCTIVDLAAELAAHGAATR